LYYNELVALWKHKVKNDTEAGGASLKGVKPLKF
jgi:hypothetical protein